MKNTTLCHIVKDNSYLMLHRNKKENDENKDKYIGPGGKFEEGESPEECVLREVYEETGLTLTHYRYCGIVTFVSNEHRTEYMHLFYADEFTGELTDCDEGTPEWISREKFNSLPQWEGDKIFIRLMEEGADFFSLKLVYEGDKLVRAVLNGKIIR